MLERSSPVPLLPILVTWLPEPPKTSGCPEKGCFRTSCCSGSQILQQNSAPGACFGVFEPQFWCSNSVRTVSGRRTQDLDSRLRSSPCARSLFGLAMGFSLVARLRPTASAPWPIFRWPTSPLSRFSFIRGRNSKTDSNLSS